jgi:hypothetical protein
MNFPVLNKTSKAAITEMFVKELTSLNNAGKVITYDFTEEQPEFITIDNNTKCSYCGTKHNKTNCPNCGANKSEKFKGFVFK